MQKIKVYTQSKDESIVKGHILYDNFIVLSFSFVFYTLSLQKAKPREKIESGKSSSNK